MDRNPALVASNYVLNIVELQNTVTSASGLTPLGALSAQVSQIQQMVNFAEKRVNANTLATFDSGSIQVISPLITASGATIGGSGAVATSTVGSASTTLVLNDSALLLTQQGVSTLVIPSTGNAMFSGTVTAAAFITASDRRLKQNVRPLEYETALSSIRGVRFDWTATGAPDVGVIAQEVAPVLPEAVFETMNGNLGVVYDKIIPVLIEAVRGLSARVADLESRLNEGRKSP
jgi:hypothetical protein